MSEPSPFQFFRTEQEAKSWSAEDENRRVETISETEYISPESGWTFIQ